MQPITDWNGVSKTPSTNQKTKKQFEQPFFGGVAGTTIYWLRHHSFITALWIQIMSRNLKPQPWGWNNLQIAFAIPEHRGYKICFKFTNVSIKELKILTREVMDANDAILDKNLRVLKNHTRERFDNIGVYTVQLGPLFYNA